MVYVGMSQRVETERGVEKKKQTLIRPPSSSSYLELLLGLGVVVNHGHMQVQTDKVRTHDGGIL
jgi:hypothetical protein